MMEFFFYSPRLPQLGDIQSLVSWLQEEFAAYGYASPTIREDKCDAKGSHARVEEPGLFSAVLHMETGLEASALNTAYCTKYIGLPDEIIDKIRDARSRLRVSFGPEDENHPEDCVDFVAVLSQIEDSCFFGPTEFHRKKMEQNKKSVTKNWVIKRLKPVVTPVLNEQGFVADDLSFKHPDGRILEIQFMTKANYEYWLCTRGSFEVVAFYPLNGGLLLNRTIPTEDNCFTRYIEPDGSNIEEQLAELQLMLTPVADDWWDFE